ncbi:MAG TPA: prephenate dehydrogenase [Gemmatimonadales bacterium]|nr:prephenate dehydrogenase [Gemmatimonadales bacterium]
MYPESLAVIGLGAIGGSVAWQARRAGVLRVIGFTPEPGEGAAATEAGAVTGLAETPVAALRGAELILLAVPPHITLRLIGQLAPHLEPGSVLTDVASVKAPVVARAVQAGLGGRFAGGHPLAGTHHSGFAHACPDLLRGCIAYVCPTGVPGGESAAARVIEFWGSVMKATPVPIDAAEHDRQLAWTSHLPQAVASALAAALAARQLESRAFGTGARDTTRLAASSPDLWLDISLQNREPVLTALADVEGRLAELRTLLAERDEAGLRAFLAAAATFRTGLET